MTTTEPSATSRIPTVFGWDADPGDDAIYVEVHAEGGITYAIPDEPTDTDHHELIHDAIDSYAGDRPWSYGGWHHAELYIDGEQVDGSDFSFDDEEDDDDNDDQEGVVKIHDDDPRRPADTSTTPELAAVDVVSVDMVSCTSDAEHREPWAR